MKTFLNWLKNKINENQDPKTIRDLGIDGVPDGVKKQIDVFSSDDWLRAVDAGREYQMIKFADVKFDSIEKYYANLDQSINTIRDIKTLKIGQKIADYAIRKTPYWVVTGVDETKNVVYLDPIKPNPYVPDASGKMVGAGGHEFTAHDFDVMSGEYESRKIDQLLDIINSKNYHDPRDVAYILLGTVPVQSGPNGSQGGWYNVFDRHNRGSLKSMTIEQIIQKDAETLKKLGFSVPAKSLNGTIKPDAWNAYVEGGYVPRGQEQESQLEEEDFQDAQTMAKIILTHNQPQIRERNADLLIKMYSDNPDGFEPLIRDVSMKLAAQPQFGKDFDRNYNVKGKFIWLAWHNKWQDILDAFQDSPESDNRRYVSHGYKESGNVDAIIEMIKKETSSEAVGSMLNDLWSMKFEGKISYFTSAEEKVSIYKKLFEEDAESKDVVIFFCSNKDKIKKVIDNHQYHKKDGGIIFDRFSKLCELI